MANGDICHIAQWPMSYNYLYASSLSAVCSIRKLGFPDQYEYFTPCVILRHVNLAAYDIQHDDAKQKTDNQSYQKKNHEQAQPWQTS